MNLQLNNRLVIEHPALTVGQLSEQISCPSAPIKRSTHVGNQPPHELLLMLDFPPGIDIGMVDTIQGNDKYSSPRDIILDRERLPLCSKQEASGRVVGSIAISKVELPTDLTLACSPELGETLSEFHARAISMLQPNNQPQVLSAQFARHPEIMRAAMGQTHALGEVLCRADSSGRIVMCGDEEIEDVGVFGLLDESPINEGVLPPLNGMMATDILISAIGLNADKTIHLAGPDMIHYTRDQLRMNRVETIIAKTAAELGVIVAGHCYQIVDITGLRRIVPMATHASQHQLLRARSVVNVDLTQHINAPCGSL